MTMNPDPQQGGLLGFFQRMRKPNEQTGLSPFQRFGAALDPLILPEMRAGQQIREQGAQRVAQGNKNRTIAELEKMASQNPMAAQLLSAVKAGAISPAEASGMSSRRSAYMRIRRPMRSLRPFDELYTAAPCLTLPE